MPAFLAAGHDLPKPYGAEEKLHYSVHAGRAKENSAFGLITSFAWTGRRFGLTTELDLIPLDRTKPTHPSTFHGIVVEQEGTPAFVIHQGASKLKLGADGRLYDAGLAAFRSGWVLTGKSQGGLRETTEGMWLAADDLVIADVHDDPVGFAAEGRKWIDVSIGKQILVAYEGRRAAYATLVSTGISGMADPATTHATVRGIFYVHAKHVSATMDGNESDDSVRPATTCPTSSTSTRGTRSTAPSGTTSSATRAATAASTWPRRRRLAVRVDRPGRAARLARGRQRRGRHPRLDARMTDR